ncbi:2'-5' RNA ligase family protein [Brevundimonas sp.]|uniref:2'-5' RNA ligase family protein n=1 Tax=Brevundimonas sp. TaxID=1871086 RepID=UPI00356590BA
MSDLPPLIVTAALDDGAFAWFEDLRQSHFPRLRNKVPAHLTLFHALPGEHEREVARTLKAACQRRSAFPLDVRGPWSLGRGVAYKLASSDLEGLRKELAESFSPWLTRQDSSPYRPHITVQNKVEPDEARLLLETLQLEFEPFQIFAEGLMLWRYLGGPWALVERFEFEAP